MTPARTGSPLRVLVCPQEFKGSLTAQQATRAIAAGVRRALPDAEVVELAMADGGPGTAAIVCGAADRALVGGRFANPLGEPIEAQYGTLPDGGAVIEAAATAGLMFVPESRRDPARATTHGVGEQIAAALEAGARRLIVGVGGTGTNDGGAGAASALGYRLLGSDGAPLPPGGLALGDLDRIDAREALPALAGADIRIAVDVTNPLLGTLGATAVYGPQKGVTPALAPQLEAGLVRWAERCERDLGVAIGELAGGGAGGGLAAGLVAACGASIEPGAALVAKAIGIAARIAEAELVITGEGRLDAQTAFGKTVVHISAVARESNRPCLAVAGSIDETPQGIGDVEAAGQGMPLHEAMARAPELVEAAAERLVRRHLRGAG